MDCSFALCCPLHVRPSPHHLPSCAMGACGRTLPLRVRPLLPITCGSRHLSLLIRSPSNFRILLGLVPSRGYPSLTPPLYTHDSSPLPHSLSLQPFADVTFNPYPFLTHRPASLLLPQFILAGGSYSSSHSLACSRVSAAVRSCYCALDSWGAPRGAWVLLAHGSYSLPPQRRRKPANERLNLKLCIAHPTFPPFLPLAPSSLPALPPPRAFRTAK